MGEEVGDGGNDAGFEDIFKGAIGLRLPGNTSAVFMAESEEMTFAVGDHLDLPHLLETVVDADFSRRVIRMPRPRGAILFVAVIARGGRAFYEARWANVMSLPRGAAS